MRTRAPAVVIKMKNRIDKISAEQKSFLVDFMEDHIDFCQGKLLGSKGRMQYNRLWRYLSETLNSLVGPTKSIIKWQKVWIDIKNKTKKKAIEIRNSRYNADSGSTTLRMSDLDERIINLMSKETIFIGSTGNTPLETSENLPSTSTSSPGQGILEDSTPDTTLTTEEPVICFVKSEPSQESAPEIEYESEWHCASTSNSHSSAQLKCREMERCTAAEAIKNLTQVTTTLNANVQEIGKALKELVEEKKKTNILLQELIQAIRK